MQISFEEDLNKAVDALRKGGVILYTTDTIWGLGCDATNPEAVSRLYSIKKQSEGKACLSLVDGPAMLERYLNVFPEAADMLIEAAVAPLTIIFDSPKGIAPALLSEDGSAAFRITSEKFSRELCRRFRKPIVSTSANFSGRPSPASFNEIDDELLNSVDYTVCTGCESYGGHKPSEIIKVKNNGEIRIIRR